MKSSKTTGVVMAAILMAGLLYLALRPNPGPKVHGRPVSAWISEAARLGKTPEERTEIHGALNAVREVAGESVPYLKRGVAEEGHLAKAYRWVYGHCWAWLGKQTAKKLPSPVSGYARQSICVNLLGAVGPEAAPAAPSLANVVANGKATSIRWRAAMALAEIGAGGREVVQGLAEGLKDSDLKVRGWSAVALGEIPSHAKAVVPELTQVLETANDGYSKWTAARALGQIGPPALAAVPALQEAMASGSSMVRAQAAAALWRINGNTVDTVNVLRRLLEDGERGPGFVAARWLGRMGKAARSSSGALHEMLDLGYYALPSGTAVLSLWRLGELPKRKALPLLVRRLEEYVGDEPEERVWMDSLYITGAELVPDLVSMLTSDDRYIRIKAASSLGALGALAEAAIPALTRAKGDGDLKVSKAAQKAIHEINESKAKIAAKRGWGRPQSWF